MPKCDKYDAKIHGNKMLKKLDICFELCPIHPHSAGEEGVWSATIVGDIESVPKGYGGQNDCFYFKVESTLVIFKASIFLKKSLLFLKTTV